MVFDPRRAAPVAGVRNEGLNFGNLVADSKIVGDGDHAGGGGIGRNLECCHCGGEHPKGNCPKRAEIYIYKNKG